MATLDILHLSDLHFGAGDAHAWNKPIDGLPPHDQPTLLTTLLQDMTLLGVAPQLVIVSGDLLDKGAEAGIAPVSAFLTELIQRLALDIERLFIIPGNHDVLRNTEERYVSYDRIYESLFRRRAFPATTPPHQRVETRYIDDLGVEVVGFNSCEQADDTDYAGYVGDAQRRRASELLRTGDHFRIAVMHHHLVPPQGEVQRDLSVMRDGGSVREWLMAQRCQLILHGHQHVDWQNVHIEDDGFHQSIVGGASAGVGDYGRQHWELKLGYQIISVRDHVGTRRRRHYFRQERKWLDGAGGDVSRRLWFGVQPNAPQTPGAPTGTPQGSWTAVGFNPNVDRTLVEATRDRMEELRAYLRSAAAALAPPPTGDALPVYVSRLLEATDEPSVQLCRAFGLSSSAEEQHALAVLLRSQGTSSQLHKSVTAQRVSHILWRFGYTLELITDDWSGPSQKVIRDLQYLCNTHVIARAPTLRDVAVFLAAGYMPPQFAESAPDPRVFAVLRALSRPGTLLGTELEEAKTAALDELYRILELERTTRGRFQDSSNAWWALRTGSNLDDRRFAPLVDVIARRFAEAQTPDSNVTRNADLPEIYVPLRTIAYTLSNAKDIVEKSREISANDRELLHAVIISMHEQIIDAPVDPQLYLASVHYESLHRFIEYSEHVATT